MQPIAMAVTLQTIADALGLSRSTVSRALNHSPLISEEVRKRVQAEARALNYRPDPRAVSLGRKKIQSGGEVLAFVTSGEKSISALGTPRIVHQGAMAHCKMLGYQLEHFPMKKGEEVRCLDILYARGIRGVIFSSFPPIHIASLHENEEFQKRLERFSSKTVGLLPLHPLMGTVFNDVFFSLQLTLTHCENAGFKRPGLVVREENVRYDRGLRISSLLKAYYEGRFKGEAPILVQSESMDEQELFAWVKKKKPDVLLTVNHDLIRWAEHAGISVPGEIACLTLNLTNENMAGIDQNPKAMGKQAVLLLSGLLHEHSSGLSPSPLSHRLPGCWRDGPGFPYM